MGTFDQGTRDLQERVGNGDLTGTLVVDQVYAAPHHEGHWVTGPLAGHVIKHHPQGGQAHFLSEPLFEKAPEYVQRLADNALKQDGLVHAMASNMENLSREVFDKAPREFEDLRNSGHPTVTDDGHTVYDRPPVRERLSKAQLKAKAKLKRLGEGVPRERTTA